jgi:acyl-CoA hydrolase
MPRRYPRRARGRNGKTAPFALLAPPRLSILGRMGRRLASCAEAAALVRRRDTVASGYVTGQATGILTALGERTDLEDVTVHLGILARPYGFLTRPGVRVLSAFFGPIERMARAAGARVEFVAADFHGCEQLLLAARPRVVLAPTSPPDADGWLSFGLHAGATVRAFRDAARDPGRLAVAEANARMPSCLGLPEHGDHRIHVDEVDAWVAHDELPATLPTAPPSAVERAIAAHVVPLVGDGATLQFGIGGTPEEVARLLADGPHGDFGVHTEMFSDGLMLLQRAGKVTNARKGLWDGVGVTTFALGSAELYAWLDDNPAVRFLPVSATNDVAAIRRLHRFVSVNGALAVDLHGQVAADHVGGRQYSGIGGHETFVTGAREAPGGTSVLCLKSTATVGGTRISTIVPHLGERAVATTPRHQVQWVVTEHGAHNLFGLGDRERAAALVELAHPDFRDELRAALA